MAFLARARERIPVCSQTFSKGPDYFVKGVYPVFLKRGEGATVWDEDGNAFVDYILGLGAVSLGYCYPEVDEAILRQLRDGISFSLPHVLEVELADLLCEAIPCAEKVRYVKSGSEATSAAVRVARAYTGREKIIYGSSHYHGWHDWFSAVTPRDAGIPRSLKNLMVPFHYNDLESLEWAFSENPGKVAAVIMEPVVMEEPKPGFLKSVLDVAHAEGAVVIFDEMVTGFHWATGGAQEHYGVTPDLATFGKGMANGMPLSAVVGRGDVMDIFEEIFVSSTFGGETLSLAAAVATVRVFRDEGVAAHLWKLGLKFRDEFNALSRGLGVDSECVGEAPHPRIVVRDKTGQETPEVKSLFLQETIRRGVLFHPAGLNFCFSHTDSDLESTLNVCREALLEVRDALKANAVAERLDGEPYSQVFKRN